MTRILIVETASPKRIRKKTEEMLAGGIYPAPAITILSRDNPDIVRYLSEIPGVRIIALDRYRQSEILEELNNEKFDILYTFWTGEKQYRRNKIIALRLRAKSTYVDIGDGHEFRLTPRNFLSFCLIRWKYPLPTDHSELFQKWELPIVIDNYAGEKVLIIQSADPSYVERTLESFREHPVFRDPRYTLFCRNTPEIAGKFRRNPMLHEVRTHSETRGSLRHLLLLRRESYDGVVVFFTGDPSYWKIKYFAFLVGARHKLIVNENSDCFFFSFGSWLALVAHRLGDYSRQKISARWTYQLHLLFFLLVKAAILPLRFAWLLLVWLRLRLSGLRG